MWYKLTVYNSETLYGWTRDPNVARAATDWLNRNSEVNCYRLEQLGDNTDLFDLYGDGQLHDLSDRTDLMFDNDTTTEDYTAS